MFHRPKPNSVNNGKSLHFEVFVYGYQGCPRLEVEVEIPLPEEMLIPGSNGTTVANLTRLDPFAVEMGFILFKDLKHGGVFMCEFCGKPARENIMDRMSWTHLPFPPIGLGPRETLYVHPVCNAAIGPCREAAKSIQRYSAAVTKSQNTFTMDDFDRMVGGPPDPTILYALNSSCAGCEEEDNEDGTKKKMMRCSNCKITRYCGRDCQKADYQRHKTICKYVMAVRFVEEDGIPKILK